MKPGVRANRVCERPILLELRRLLRARKTPVSIDEAPSFYFSGGVPHHEKVPVLLILLLSAPVCNVLLLSLLLSATGLFFSEETRLALFLAGQTHDEYADRVPVVRGRKIPPRHFAGPGRPAHQPGRQQRHPAVWAIARWILRPRASLRNCVRSISITTVTRFGPTSRRCSIRTPHGSCRSGRSGRINIEGHCDERGTKSTT